jgi:hypothetical protein
MKKGIFAALILWLLLPMSAAFAKGDWQLTVTEPSWNYHGLWWGARGSEPGWAIGIAHQGKTIRATWFTYDTDGSPMWLVMPESTRTYGWISDVYSGPLYRTTGPDASPVSTTPVGTASFTFNGGAFANFSYSVNGSRGSKDIERQVMATRLPRCEVGGPPGSAPNYTDLWGAESAWGIQVEHQVGVLSAVWFTHRPDGKGEWLVMPRAERVGDTAYSGALYRTRGPAFDKSPWNPAQVTAAQVGATTFTFLKHYDYTSESTYSEVEYATLDFTLDGVSGSKVISREEFAWPVSVCRE